MIDSHTVLLEVYSSIEHWHKKIFEKLITISNILDHISISHIDENKAVVNFISFDNKEYYYKTQDIVFSPEQKLAIINSTAKRLLCMNRS
jgi:hypothetical protein